MWNSGKVFNPLCEVEFAGFRSDTLTLQRAGWQLAFEHDHMGKVRLALKHEPARIYALTHSVDMTPFRYNDNMSIPVVFQVGQMIGSHLQLAVAAPLKWSAFDATPEYCPDFTVKSVEDLIPFRAISSDAPEIVIAQENVGSMLEAILKMQDPKQAEIRARQRKEAWLIDKGLKERREGYTPQRDIKAQIVCIAS